MSQINISRLTFAHYGAFENLFDNVYLNLDTDWKLGFIGRNGRGKTTFLRLLMNEYEYSGSITASVNFDYFPFEVSDMSRLTSEILYEINPEMEEWKMLKELSALKVNEDVLSRPFETLSGGEKTKVLLAALFLKDNNFLLIDEPTNHLDMEARDMVGDYLRRKSGFILISHDRRFLDQCVDHVLSINKADIEVQKGNFSSWQENRINRDNFEKARTEKLKSDIKRLDEAARRNAGWSDMTEKTKTGHGVPDRGYVGHKASKMMKRSKAVEARRHKAAEEKRSLLHNIETSDNLIISTAKHHSKRLLTMIDLSISYGSRKIAEGINLTLNQGERLVLLGPNGSGKSSLLKLAAGENIPCSGYFSKASGLKISYVPQDASFLKGGLRDFSQKNDLDESLFKAILHKLGFDKKQFETDLADFSGGQKKKVLIAASLSSRAHLYIWDEPLNFIDVISRMQIEKLIADHQPTMLLVEHDREFIQNIDAGHLEL